MLLRFLLLFSFFQVIYSYEHLGDGVYIQRNTQIDISKPKIAILSVIIGGDKSDVSERYLDYSYSDIVAFGTLTKEVYANKHGYDLIIATDRLTEAFKIPESRILGAAWTKIVLINSFLSEYDWVFWSDADSVILNFDLPLEDFLDPDYDIIACDKNVFDVEIKALDNTQDINSGQVFYKNSPRSRFVLYQTWLCHSNITPGSFEQQWINATIHNNNLEPYVKVYPQKAFNTLPDLFTPGNFIIHFWGFHGKELSEKFREVEERWGYLVESEIQIFRESL